MKRTIFIELVIKHRHLTYRIPLFRLSGQCSFIIPNSNRKRPCRYRSRIFMVRSSIDFLLSSKFKISSSKIVLFFRLLLVRIEG